MVGEPSQAVRKEIHEAWLWDDDECDIRRPDGEYAVTSGDILKSLSELVEEARAGPAREVLVDNHRVAMLVGFRKLISRVLDEIQRFLSAVRDDVEPDR